MNKIEQLLEVLKSQIKSRGFTYKQIAKKLGISESNLKRNFSKKIFSIDRLIAICEIIELDFYDLAKIASGQTYDIKETLSLKQETVLANNPELFTYFYLLLAGNSDEKINKNYFFNKNTQLFLFELDKLKLIELLPKNKVRLLVKENVRWLTNGPLITKYESQIKKEFLDSKFNGVNEKLRLLSGRFNKYALNQFTLKLEKLIGEFIELSNSTLEKSDSEQIWFLLAYRPWIFSVASKYFKSKI